MTLCVLVFKWNRMAGAGSFHTSALSRSSALSHEEPRCYSIVRRRRLHDGVKQTEMRDSRPKR